MSYRQDDPKFPYIHRLNMHGREVLICMVNTRSESWYHDAVNANKEYLDLIHAGDRVIDLGSNESVIAVLSAIKAGPTGKVMAVEAAPHNWEPTDLNIALNNLRERMITVRAAISDYKGKIEMSGEVIGLTGGEQTVDCITLDSLIDFAPSIIKCDNEGYELKAFRGGLELLRKYRPLIFLEPHIDGPVSMRNYGDTPDDLFSLMTDIGYEFFQDGRKINSGAEITGVVILRHKEPIVRTQPTIDPPKAFCITLKRSRPRYELRARLEFNRAGIHAEFFDGLDNGRALLKTTITGRNGKELKYANIGCTLSHLMLWRTLMHIPGDEFLIFEDDVILEPNFKEQFNLCMKEIPADWDFVFVGADNVNEHNTTQLSPRIARVEYPYGTHAYMVKKRILPVLIETMDTVSTYIDLHLAWDALPRLKHYTFTPSIARQLSSETLIRQV